MSDKSSPIEEQHAALDTLAEFITETTTASSAKRLHLQHIVGQLRTQLPPRPPKQMTVAALRRLLLSVPNDAVIAFESDQYYHDVYGAEWSPQHNVLVLSYEYTEPPA